MAHKHFTKEDRILLQKLKITDTNNADCARILGFHPSTIGRELTRGGAATATGYSIRSAHTKATETRTAANQQHRKLLTGGVQSLGICVLLARYYSPEQIANKLRVSHGTVYRFLWNRSRQFLNLAWKFLRHRKMRRKYGTRRREKQRELAKKRWIDDRPKNANERLWFGHWEGDTVHGHKHSGYLVTHVERKSGFLLAALIPKCTKENFRIATEQLMQELPARLMRSITLDNGSEMNDYEEMESHLSTPIYFAHPYHSWERGSNENTNGLLRYFFPKKSSFATLTQEELDRAVHLINTRPRKRLAWRTPAQMFKR